MAVMMTLDEVAAFVVDLPAVTEGERHGNRTWSVAGKAFAWVRPFSKADIRRFAEVRPPDGPIVAVRVADLGDKEALLAVQSRGVLHDSALRWVSRRPHPAQGRHQASGTRRACRGLACLRTQSARRTFDRTQRRLAGADNRLRAARTCVSGTTRCRRCERMKGTRSGTRAAPSGPSTTTTTRDAIHQSR